MTTSRAQRTPMTPHELAEAHGGVWGKHPDYPPSDWHYEVANNDTRLGYWEWVCWQIAGERDDG